MKKILILEDHPASIEHITNIILDMDIKSTIYPFRNTQNAYQCAMEKTIDLFLIDIILDTAHPGDTSGLRFVENIRNIKHYNFTPVIFITSLEDPKMYAYAHLHCYSFIEKPFEENKVKQTIEQSLQFPQNSQNNKMVYFRKDGIIFAVERNDIVYANSINHIMHIHTKQGDTLHIPYLTIKQLLEDTDSPDLLQCSRNVLVNKRYIENIDIPNRFIQLKKQYGRIEIGVMFKKYIKESFK